jgi:pectate disaccharide-lyase
MNPPMNKTLCLAALLTLLAAAAPATIYYVAPGGSDSNSGTNLAAPFAGPQTALALAAAGDTVYLRGGTYHLTAQLKPAKAGTAAACCNLFAYPGERPVLDFSGTPAATKALYLGKDYWHLKGIEIQKATDNGIFIGGGWLLIEGCVVHDCNNDGICLGSTSLRPHDCLVLNCDSYLNINLSTGGQDGDGYCGKDGCGPNNTFSGCRSWNNADDGWDFYNNVTNFVTLTNCWSFRNGVDSWNLGGAFVGNGNGFKLGGAGTKAQHVLKNCLAFENVHKGFDQNYDAGGITLHNCTAYSNQLDYSFPATLVVGTNDFRNNIAYLYFVGTKATYGLTNLNPAGLIMQSNSWQGMNVSDADFASLDTSTATNARNADYSLPNVNFLHLAAGSRLIDAGVNVGLPFNGAAPDLGAFEYTNGGGASQGPIAFNPAGCGVTGGIFHLTIGGLSSHGPVVVLVSSNLVTWTPVLTNPAASGSLTYTDTNAPGSPRRFYRAEER